MKYKLMSSKACRPIRSTAGAAGLDLTVAWAEPLDDAIRYHSEVSAVMYLNEPWAQHYHAGERFAQLVIVPQPAFELVECDELTPTERGEGGYGSTGR